MAGPSKIELTDVLSAQEKVSIGGDCKIGSNETTIHTQINLSATASSGHSPHKKLKTCCKKTETNQLPCDVLQQKLREFYKGMVLSKIAWMEDEREFLIQDYFVDLILTDSNKTIKLEEIFNKANEGEKPLRIYIEGQPGYGKTTLANKLVNDWAIQKEYIKHFQLVFLLPLREMHGRSIQEAITSIGQHFCLEDLNAVDVANNHKNETLFIFDGLDEVSLEDRSVILKTLYKIEYSEVTLIVFSRTGLFCLTKVEHASLFRGINKSSNFHDRNISILGIDTNKKKKKFIEKILPTHDVDKILDSLKPNLELFDSPLFLMLLTIIASERKIIETFINQTEIYKMLFNFIIQHHLIKSGFNINTDFDLFQLNSEINETQSLIQQFGKLSLKKIAKNELQFESDNLTKQIYNAGFLINHKQMTNFRFKNYYEAFHLSFLEFASAYALWVDFKYNNPNLESFLKSQVLHFFAKRRTSLVLVFLASLMQDDMDKFISQIKPFSIYFSLHLKTTVTLFEYCTSINWNEKSNIIDLLPSVIDLRDFDRPSNICKHLITHGNKYDKIKYIIISYRTNQELIPSKISSNSQIIFEFTNGINLKQIRYPKGHCDAKDIVTHLIKNTLSLREQLNYIASSNTESCVLCLNKDNNTQILKMILESRFKKIMFECLSVTNPNDNQLQMITKLIKNHQVEYLEVNLYFSNFKSNNDLIVAAGKSKYLTSIRVTGSNIDLYHLTNGGTKNYHFIHLDDCTLSCSSSLIQKNCCHHLKITKYTHFEKIDAIIEMEPTSLTCNSDLLGYVLRKYPNWNGFNSIKSLCLCQNSFKIKDVDNICVDKKLVLWNKLKTLYMDVESDIDDKAIVKCVQMFGIENFAINTDFYHLDNLIKCFNEMKVCLNKIKLILELGIIQMHYIGYLTELLHSIKCNHWMKVNVVCLLDFNEILFYYKTINQLNDFNAAHFTYESHEDDVDKLKTQIYALPLAYYAFCVTKKL